MNIAVALPYRTLRPCLAVGLLALFARGAAAQTFEPLGPIEFGPDYITVFPRGVSADGTIVAGFTIDGGGVEEAIRWQNSVRTGLGYLPGAPVIAASEGSAISADGQVIVGWSSVALSGTGQNRTEPFRFAGAGPMSSLGRLPNTRDRLTQATGVNGDGSVVVGWDQRAPTGISAWKWTSAGGIVDLGALAGSTLGAVARGVTPGGETVFGDGDTGQNDNVAWRKRGANFEVLGDLPGATVDATPFAASSDGEVIVGRGRVFGAGFGNRYEAFRWDGAMTGLGDLPGGDFTSEAYGTTADGNIVVGFSADGSDQERGAFIWDEIHGMRDLRTVLINEFGLTALTDWNLDAAYAISPDGRTIIGDGLAPSGAFQGWIVTIPEPSVAALLAIACTLIRSRRR